MRKYAVLLFGVLCTAGSAILVRGAQVDGRASAFYRIAFAFLVLAPVYLSRKVHAERPREILLCLLGGVFFGIDLALWNTSVMISGATLPTLIVNLSTVWVGLGAALFLGEALGPRHWLGNGLALVGVLLVLGPGTILGRGQGLGSLQGPALALLASVFLALYTLCAKGARQGMDALAILFYASLGSLAVLLPTCLLGGIGLGGFSPATWACLAGMGILVQLGGYLCFNYALGHFPSAQVSLAFLLQPVLTGLIAAVLFGEGLGPRTIAGGLVVLLGLGLSLVPGKGPGRHLK